MTYIDSLGFHRTRLDEYLANLQAGVRSIYGTDINLDPDTADGQLIGVFAEQISDLAGVLEDVYNGRSPAGAIGAGLARLVRINGVQKKDPVFSVAVVTLSGLSGTVIPQGALIGSSVDATIKFATIAPYTIGGGGTVAGFAQYPTAAPISAPAGTLTLPLTVIPGWTGVTNPSDASIGNTGETDPALRARRALSVAIPSQAILDGLEAALLQIPNVQQARVRENPEDTTQTLADGGTLVAHAIEVMAMPAGGGSFTSDDLAAIAQTIWLKKSLGVTTVGVNNQAVVDSQGVSHTIYFDTPTAGIFLKPIYVEVHTAVALSGANQVAVAQAIQDRGNGILTVNGEALPGSQLAETVAVSDIYDAITALKLISIPSLKVSKIFIGLSPGPTTETDIPMLFNWIATWNAANVTFASP